MEGTSTQAELEDFLSRQNPKVNSMSRRHLSRPSEAPCGPEIGSASRPFAPHIRSSSRPRLRQGVELTRPAVLIEATCNQVNHEGGYTGMTSSDFRSFVEAIAEGSGSRARS